MATNSSIKMLMVLDGLIVLTNLLKDTPAFLFRKNKLFCILIFVEIPCPNLNLVVFVKVEMCHKYSVGDDTKINDWQHVCLKLLE